MAPSPTISFYLLRGLARETRHWGIFTSILEQSNSSFQVIPLEIPGTGYLRTKKAPIRVKEYVQVIRSQYLRHASKHHYNIIVGMSFGGMIATSWAAIHPQDFQAAVLINTSCNDSALLKRISPQGVVQLLLAALCPGNYGKEKRIAQLICNLADTNKVAKEWASIRKKSPVSPMQAFRQLYSAAKFCLPPGVEIPILLLSSKKDRLVSPQCSEDISLRIPSKLIYHTLAGHDIPTDDPQWCVSTIKKWVNQHAVS